MYKDLDTCLFKKIYFITTRHSMVEKVAVLVTNWSSKVFHITYIGFILYLVAKGDNRIIPFIIGPATGLLLARGMKLAWKRERPFVALDVKNLVTHNPGFSFPSMHAMSAFVIAMSVWYINRPLGCGLLIFAGIAGLSRVMVGVHYPLDIIAGCTVGLLISSVAFLAW